MLPSLASDLSAAVLVRAFRTADAAALGVLLGRVFSPRVGSLVRWKYLENPALPEPLIAVAEAPGGELVGCYPLVGREFHFEGRTHLAVFGADLAVLPEYRTGGDLHHRLCELVESAARARGAAFAYGFPNPDAYRVSKRWFGLLDWTTLETWSLKLGRWPQLRFWSSAPAGRASSAPPDSWEALQSTVEGAGIRSRAFFAWRFADPGKYRLRLGADPEGGEYLVVRDAIPQEGDPEAVVVDFGPGGSEPGLAALLVAEIAGQKRARVRSLMIACLPDSTMARAARRTGFRRRPERDRKVTVKALAGGFPPVPSHLTLADADDP